MKNLVIGSEGFVGQSFCRFLESTGEEVVRFDIKRDSGEDARTARLMLESIDFVYLLAWDVGGSKYLYKRDSQVFQLRWNVAILANVMPQLQEAEVPFLFVSTQLAEETHTAYGSSKRLGEVWTSLLNGSFARLWNVYGPLEEPNERSHVVADFVFQAVHEGEIKMMTTGDELRQFVHIEDVCRGLHIAATERVRGIHDITSFEWVSVGEVAERIARLANARVVRGTRIGTTPRTPMAGKIPGWIPEVDLDDGLMRLVEARAGSSS